LSKLFDGAYNGLGFASSLAKMLGLMLAMIERKGFAALLAN